MSEVICDNCSGEVSSVTKIDDSRYSDGFIEVCGECYGYCYSCGCDKVSEMRDNGDSEKIRMCEECFEEMSICEKCGELVYYENAVMDSNQMCYCEGCYDYYVENCKGCDEAYEKSDMKFIENEHEVNCIGFYICDGCVEDMCEGCHDIDSSDAFTEIEGKKYCSYCWEECSYCGKRDVDGSIDYDDSSRMSCRDCEEKNYGEGRDE